jgi:hypothetical protein
MHVRGRDARRVEFAADDIGYDEWRVVDRFAVVADRAPRSWPYVVSAGTACGDVCWINGSTVIGFRDYIVY